MFDNGATNELLRLRDRFLQLVAARESSRDGRRIGATCPVSRDAGDKRRGKFRDRAGIEEQIGRDLTMEMTPLEQKARPEFARQFFARRPHLREIAHWSSGQGGRLGHVWGHECGAGKESGAISRNRCRLQQRIAAGRNHDRIDDERNMSELLEHVGNRLDDLRRVKHARFDRSDREMRETKLDLFAHVFRVDAIDPRHFAGHFRDHASDRGEAENAERAEGFEIGLQPCAGAAIGARDCKGDGRGGGL